MSGACETLRVAVISSDYPSRENPAANTFVHGLVNQWVDQGVEVFVLAPRPCWRPRQTELSAVEGPGEGSREGAPGSCGSTVIRPGFLSLSNKIIRPGWSTYRLSVANFRRAVKRASTSLRLRPDITYGHFLFPSGYAALALGRRLGVPAVVALGESRLQHYEDMLGRDMPLKVLQGFAGILSVSKENRDYCVDRFGASSDDIFTLPNATDPLLFYPRDKLAMRRKLGLPEHRPIAVFVGHFNERKGPLRLLRSVRDLPEVGLVFLGAGAQTPQGSQVLFAGRVTQSEIPEWLSAGDVFVMPTEAEGSPNALIEAMACGLPSVASDIAPIRETVSEEATILVDPRDETAIRDGIAAIIHDPIRAETMSAAALEQGTRSSLPQRAERIRLWLTELAKGSAGSS